MAKPRGEFAGMLRELRSRARLTQDELATAAGLSLRAVSDLERGMVATPQRATVQLLGDALGLVGADRLRFEAAARGRELVTAPAAAVATRSLPRDVASFTGRQRELGQLADSAGAGGGVVSIHAIGGMAGVGKTAFAVHAGHRLGDPGRFPGGQVFLPLHGHTPGRAPVDPPDALASLLLAVGVSPAQVPPGLEARMALWRDRAAERPLLLVLDDAAGSEQVRPLLPGAGGSLVLVTSRRHLSALDAVAVSLDTLPPDEAAALLVRLAGRAGLRASDPGARDIVRLCGFLPLAIGMMARQLRHHPAWSAADRAAALSSARDRLELMETENLSVAAAFDLSYAYLSDDQQRLFRRLGLHPGVDIDRYAGAALDDTGLAAARRGLEELYDHHLLTEPAEGRYRLHDLLREHARVLATRLDPEEDRSAATGRLLDFYQRTAVVASSQLRGRARPGSAGASAGPALDDTDHALAWVRAERANLLACLDHVAAAGEADRVVALTAGVSGVLQHDGPLTDAVTRHTAAIQAAKSAGDRLGQANALLDLGRVRQSTGDYPPAAQAMEQALDLYRALGEQLGEAHALSDRGQVTYLADDYRAAARLHQEALGLYRELGDRRSQAHALRLFGVALMMTEDYPAAVAPLEEAGARYREFGDRLGQANALNFLGRVRQMTGDYPASAQASREALAIYRELGSQLGQANALNFLGICLRMTGDYPAAAQASAEALGLYRERGDRGGVAMVLNELGTQRRLGGELGPALEFHRQSLALSREIASSGDEAQALAGLGRCALAAGDTAQAAARLGEALEIFQRIGAAEVPELLAELDALR